MTQSAETGGPGAPPRPVAAAAAAATPPGVEIVAPALASLDAPDARRGEARAAPGRIRRGHCERCRRQTAGPVTTLMGVADGQWRWTEVTPAVCRSSPGRERFVCPICGAPVAYRQRGQRGEIDFYAALREDADDVAAEEHGHADAALAWLVPGDTLPRTQARTQAQTQARTAPRTQPWPAPHAHAGTDAARRTGADPDRDTSRETDADE